MSTQNPPVSFYIKTNRSFSLIRKYAWIVTLLIGVGGLFIPELGLLVPLIMAALIITSLFKGKYWCGNFCPHGSFFDNLLLPISRQVKIPGFLRSRILIVAALLFFMYNMGSNFIQVYETMGTAEFYQRLGFIFANTYLMVLLVGGLLAVVINARTWCQFCPMGTIQWVFYKIGKALRLNPKTDEKVAVKHPDLCHSCARCARVCPMQLAPYLNFSENHFFEDERCIRCYTCVNNCPAGILYMASEDEVTEVSNSVSLDGFEEVRFYRSRIKNISELKEDVWEFTFELLEPTRMPYVPGQFVLVEIDSSIKMFRAYTISSSNPDQSEISVTVKKLEDGYGTNLIFNSLKEGDLLTLKGPMGRDLRVDPSSPELLFISNGIGVTPFVSIVQSLLEREDYPFSGKATLLYGARYEEDLIYDYYFQKMAEASGQFNYQRVLSRPQSNHYPKGYVTDLVKEYHPAHHVQVYICGTSPMAEKAEKILVEKGIPEANIYYENFGV